MKKLVWTTLALAAAFTSAPALADASSGRKLQAKGTQAIPVCSRNLGTVAIIEPDKQWWRELSLGSPEAILRVFVQKSGCFTLVNRGRSLQNSAMERALAEQGELQRGSNIGKGQIKAADYFLQPDIVSTNNNSGGNNVGAVLGGLGGMFGRGFGAVAVGLNVKKGEANVTLSIVNSRTTVEEALTEGYARKSDVSFGGGGGGFFGGSFAAAGGGGYQNTQIGQIIVLAYLDAYTKLVSELGGLPADASAAAPAAR